MNNNYAKACTEVLVIISYFSKEEYSRIPKDEIRFLQKNQDKNYEYIINPEIDLSEQYISDEANVILVSLFRDYFATEKQKLILNNLLKQNQEKLEEQKIEKYNPNDIFKKKENEAIKQEETQINDKLIEYKETFFTKLINKIKKIFSI